MNWSNPDVLALYLDLAAEAYARQTEAVACEAMETSAIGTVGTAAGRLGTAGTESFAQWRAAVSAGLAGNQHRDGFEAQHEHAVPVGEPLLPARGTRHRSGGADVPGRERGHGIDERAASSGSTSSAPTASTRTRRSSETRGRSLSERTPGSPVDLRVVEPNIGGYEVGLIGAFNAVVFDVNRFFHLGTHL